MQEGKFNDHETASEFFTLQRQMSQPTPSRYVRPKPFEGIDIAAFQSDPEGAALAEMNRAFDDLASGRVKLN